ncbi:hypothetical protein LI99_09045 [Mycolicibacterium smegmatis]|uniref:Uncharacterized protein n=3 Tax=Bacteria TaxID=2 RepID=A0QTE8_MYCS2|nr:hypothetical protein MSMEG_1814 [Mycolicibacterium smegmatis MC2 155]AIU13661.1 hypothetical protein LI99_09045 [Mycolicibacterium smegmatis]AFP38242.1 hypothetical protein MSMEI_1770 [Mycolicibacterium smegmatis MC2 155]AIU07036.1 hypothetical protein LJ00_09045 [Mycolicibacterium smegmatis MC2 155]AIU20285.1 hypothetical protein LI98_09045 [Mycolicibacterium smegmatis]
MDGCARPAFRVPLSDDEMHFTHLFGYAPGDFGYLLLPLDGGGWRTPATILFARLPCPGLAVCQMSILMML